MAQGVKHLIPCHCVLTQFKNEPDPPVHQFVVFSVLGDDGMVEVKLAQCNNCGVVHRVTDICKSEIVKGREDLSSILTVDDIKMGLPEQLVTVLERHDVDFSTWEQAKWIIENQRWGDHIILSNDIVEGVRQTKVLRIIGNTIFQLNSHSSDVYI